MIVTRVELDLAKQHNVLKAYAKITFDDCFVIHGIRLIEKDGALIACMPNRKRWLDCECTGCRVSVAVLDDFCGRCGMRQSPTTARMEQLRYELGLPDGDVRVRPFLDVCHPVTRDCRVMIEEAVIYEYWRAMNEPPTTSANGHDAG